MEPGDRGGRISIEERARRRAALAGAGRDRYAALLRSLRAGREISLGRRSGARFRLAWHPAARTALLVVAVVVAVYVGALALEGWIRNTQVVTWNGPDTTVESGWVLPGCSAVPTARDPVFPSWLRWNGSVYVPADRKRPFMAIGTTNGFTDSGYSDGALHLLFIDDTAAGRARDDLFVWQQGAIEGIVFARAPGCR